MRSLFNYKNGDWDIEVYQDGTSIRTSEMEKPIYDFPCSIDIKITNKCDLACSYCHETSIPTGKHGDLNGLFMKLQDLPAGVEFAIGGGNPLEHPRLKTFLIRCREKGFICNLTVNALHLKEHIYFSQLIDYIKQDLIYGLGISVPFTYENDLPLEHLRKLSQLTDNIVLHTIAGIHDLNLFSFLKENLNVNLIKVLVLGYKQYGLGNNYYKENNSFVNENIKELKTYLISYIEDSRFIFSFDNLAIEQLNVLRWFKPEYIKEHYLGDDFTSSMYVDAVNKKFAPTSRDLSRNSWNEYSLIEYFKKYSNKENDYVK